MSPVAVSHARPVLTLPAVSDPPSPTTPSPRIGIMGGMGPAAAAQFMLLLVKRNLGARCDQDHAPALLDQATDIPDRSRAIAGDGENPVPAMLRSLSRLHAGGATHLAITCNTAHYFAPQIEDAMPSLAPGMTLVHIVDAAIDSLDRQSPGVSRIGLLATRGTLSANVYPDRAQGRQWVLPTTEEVDQWVMPGIYEGVKAGRLEHGRNLLLKAANRLVSRGAQAVLLACTEIPLVMQTGDVLDATGRVVPLVDTLEALADAVLASVSPAEKSSASRRSENDAAAQTHLALVEHS